MKTRFAITLLLAASGLALAQYKVIGADGSVTYTDRPPTTSNARITNLGRGGQQQQPPQAPAPDAALPFELRQAAQRYPVVLYTSADCAACDSGRSFLLQRGIPFSERRVGTDEEASALERAVGARTVPALTIGSQALRGLSQPEWSSFLDAAGYPRESRLPRSYAQQASAPQAPRPAASSTSPGTPASPVVPNQAPSTAPNVEPAASAVDPSGIRF